MADAGSIYTDKKVKKLENQLVEVYSEAEKDIDAKMKEFTKKFKVKESIYQKKVNDGEATQEDFDNWKKGQVFQGEQWNEKKKQISEVLTNANKVAAKMINADSIDVFAANANYMSYKMESGAGLNFGFGIYDEKTVFTLLKDNPKMLPEWKIDEPKDYVWNQKKVNNAITQGIIQGESIDKIAKRMSNGLCMANKNKSMTFAATAMTGAQNAGREKSLMDAKAKGIDVVKEWMATLDSHTRDSHKLMDGEVLKVTDIWHPAKFSNGCRFPGDPQGPPAEVYNCRCTLVGDVQEYPSIYKRYDNVDGKPIDNITYKEWYKTKYGKEVKKPTKPAAPQKVSKPKKAEPQIDYSKYGGQEAYEIMKKYNFDWNELMQASNTEFSKVYINNGSDISSVMDNMKKAKSETEALQKKGAKKATDKVAKSVDDATKKYEDAKKNLESINKEIQDKGADKKFENIWYNQTVTYADWEAKKGSIASKKEWYLENIKKLEDSGDLLKANELKGKLAELTEFEKNGEKFSKLLEDKKAAEKLAMSLKPKPDVKTMYGPEAYTQARKNAAVWAKSPKEADAALRGETGATWRAATAKERDAIYEYTSSYSKFNEPLRGWEYGQSNYKTGAGWKGVGNTDLNAGYANNGERLNAMTKIIDKCSYSDDVWLQRGCKFGGMDKFFGVDSSLLQHGTQEELEAALLGTTPIEYGFMSCGSSKGKGFSGDIVLNVYAPAGTKMMYVEPFSAFGNGKGKGWDGISDQSSFGSELETILQQGTQFMVTKVEKSGGTIFVDMDVIAQNNVQLYKK